MSIRKAILKITVISNKTLRANVFLEISEITTTAALESTNGKLLLLDSKSYHVQSRVWLVLLRKSAT